MVESLDAWLTAHGLSEFEEVFRQNQVDLKTLLILTDSDLKELDLPFGPRKRILNAIAEFEEPKWGAAQLRCPSQGALPLASEGN
jgi:hypothetical protein